jgi:hypothetical protein
MQHVDAPKLGARVHSRGFYGNWDFEVGNYGNLR